MPSPVKRPIAGVSLLSLLLLISAIAIDPAAAQSAGNNGVLNNQIQLGDVLSNQTLNVETTTGVSSGVSTATSNQLIGGFDGTPGQLTSTQTAKGKTTATLTANANTKIGDPSSLSALATANTIGFSANGANLNVQSQQTASGTQVYTNSHLEAPNGTVGVPNGTATIAAQSVANNFNSGIQNGYLTTTIRQDAQSAVAADASANVMYAPTQLVSSATAQGNSFTGNATGPSAQAHTVTQNRTTGTTQATSFVASGNSWNATSQSNAMANSVNIANTGGSLMVNSTQNTQTYVRSQAENSAYDFGQITATASGAGNSFVALNGDILTQVNTSQTAYGGVEVIAKTTGTNGYDAYANATAIGNSAVIGNCAPCQSQMTVNNNQTNLDGVTATASINVTGIGRSAIATSSAIGNSATIYVGRPKP